jgi:ParB family chromosome partitioning protein
MEDPNQPRQSFSEAALQELAASIQERGVKSPISVRPAAEGKYLINHGARRYRASLLAGKTTIPAFIDDAHDEYDKAIENIQRENLTPLEIARFIGRRLAAGAKQADIARRLGKPRSFVSEHAALLEAPPCIQALCESGRCTDSRTLYALIKAHEAFPDPVAAFVAKAEAVARSDVNRFIQWLKQEQAREQAPATEDATLATVTQDPAPAASEEETVLPVVSDPPPPEPTVTRRVESAATETPPPAPANRPGLRLIRSNG